MKGAKRWLDFIFQITTCRITKPLFILTTVRILTFEKIQTLQFKYFLSFLLLTSVIILLIDQPDLGQSILIVGT